jgi:DUF4097 and DUF4098 domain-containing protein YvlB
VRRRLAALVLLALACVYTFRLEQTETRSHSSDGIRHARFSTRTGNVAVEPGADSVISAVIRKQAYGRDSADAAQALTNIVVTEEVQGDQYRLSAEMPGGNRNYGASIHATAPESTGLTIYTTNGNVTVAAFVAGVSAQTTNGHVELTGTAGDAALKTTNGHVTLAVHHGAVSVQTTNGPVDCDVAALGATEGVSLETTNGHVVLLLPADVSATVDVQTTNGQITFHDLDPVFTVQTEDHVRATIGSGASTITVSTTNGDVRVKRRS